MWRNHCIVAWRNLSRNRTFSVINLAGLAIGLCCFLLIGLYVWNETSFDRYDPRAADIYRVNLDARWGGQDIREAQTSDMMGGLLKKDYPEVAEYTRVYNQSSTALVKHGNEYISEDRVAFVDSTFFTVFSLPAVAGDPRTALNEPNTAVIDASMALKYFGRTDVVGRMLDTRDGPDIRSYKVTAVIRDIPENTHFHFRLLFRMKDLSYNWGQIGNVNFYTYLLLKPGTDRKAFERHFDEYVIRYELPLFQEMNIHSMEEFRKAGNMIHFWLMPVRDIHLHGTAKDEIEPPGSIQYVYVFSAVALFILLLACINFMNLTTARSAGRAKEVGIRKVLGTRRGELIRQFLVESTLMAAMSLAGALVLAWMALPSFNALAGKTLHLGDLFTRYSLPLLLAFPFAVGFLAGCYPALFLSAFRPIEVLKGKLRMGGKSAGLRSILVVFQFGTSVFLIIATLVVYRQLHFIQNRNLGFQKDQVLIINGADALGNQADAFKQEALRLPGVLGGTTSSYLPVSPSDRNSWNFSKDPVSSASNNFNTQVWDIDEDYLKTLGMTLAEGRNFSPAYGSDASALIINESTARIMGYKNPIGQKLYIIDKGKPIAYPVIGVVQNFNFESMHQAIGPLVFRYAKATGLISFKVQADHVRDVINQVNKTWSSMAPSMPFSYRFMDDSFSDMYHADQQVGSIALVFSLLAIAIACLGIFGLATFMAEQRTKEIGIRKVLGASVQGIVQLLNRDFIRLVGIAYLVAAPLAAWAMHRWLEDFAFRSSIAWWVYVLAGGITLLIALCTVSFQSIRAALANPVRSLKTE